MKRMMLLMNLIVMSLTGIVLAQRELNLTIYNDNFALIKDKRTLDFQAGVNEFKFTDVAATIEPSSVRFRSLDDPEAKIVEQNFQYDLVSSAKLMEKYVDKDVEILTKTGELIIGKLLKSEPQEIILKTDKDVRIVSANIITGVKLAKLSDGLLTKPTLLWQMFTAKGGKQTIQLDYLAKNIKWDMNYNAVISNDEKTISLMGWVTISNNSSASFPSSAVTLIAGSPNREDDGQMLGWGIDYLRSMSELAPSAARGKELSESFSEYHLYRLPNKTTVKSNEMKQIRLLEADNISVEKIYLYDGAKVQFSPWQSYYDESFGREANKKINVILAVENRADRNLGVALPPGLVRVYKRDVDKSLEFIGEDKLPATAVDERVLVYIGDSFDLTGSRSQTDFRRITDRVMEESFKIELKNHKKEPVTIMVIEKLYRWSNWEILSSTDKWEKINARTIRYMIPVKPDETKTVEYRVRYSW